MKKVLTKQNCILIGIDYQTKLVPAMHEKEELIETSAKLFKGFEIFGMPIILTQQYTKGLGETVTEISDACPRAEIVEKNTFSAWDNTDFVSKFKSFKRDIVIVVGIEAHVCEQQTVLDLLDEGYKVYVAADCISSRKAFDRDIAIERMRDAGAVITTCEAILFEILKWSKDEHFKQISNLVK